MYDLRAPPATVVTVIMIPTKTSVITGRNKTTSMKSRAVLLVHPQGARSAGPPVRVLNSTQINHRLSRLFNYRHHVYIQPYYIFSIPVATQKHRRSNIVIVVPASISCFFFFPWEDR